MSTCGNCVHWKVPSQGALNVCMRFPPSVNIFTIPSRVLGGESRQVASLQYPAVQSDFPACAEFKTSRVYPAPRFEGCEV
jgi:hypothetical protein